MPIWRRLRAVADGSGLSVEQLALQVLGQAADDDRAEDHRRFEEYDRTGISISKDEWMAGLREAVAAFLYRADDNALVIGRILHTRENR